MLSEYYFVSYMRKNGKQVDEMFSNYSEANSRRNILINEFGYSEINPSRLKDKVTKGKNK